MLTLFAKLLAAFNSDDAPSQIAIAIVLGMIMGFTPLWSVHNLVLLFFVCILRINISAMIVAWAVASGASFALDPLFNSLGESLLLDSNYAAVFTEAYNNPYWRVTDFNNTITFGSFVASIAFAPVLFVLAVFIVKNYRTHILEWVEKTRLMAFLKTTKFYQIYLALTD